MVINAAQPGCLPLVAHRTSMPLVAVAIAIAFSSITSNGAGICEVASSNRTNATSQPKPVNLKLPPRVAVNHERRVREAGDLATCSIKSLSTPNSPWFDPGFNRKLQSHASDNTHQQKSNNPGIAENPAQYFCIPSTTEKSASDQTFERTGFQKLEQKFEVRKGRILLARN